MSRLISNRRIRHRAQSMAKGAWTLCTMLGCMVLTVACSDTRDAEIVTSIPATELYHTARLNYHGILLSTVSPYDTVRLAVTPVSAAGTALAGPISGSAADSTSVSYTTSDPSVQVTSDGLLTAVVPAAKVQVVARLRFRGSVFADTAYVTVTDTATPPTLAHFSLSLMPGDSARGACSGAFFNTCDKALQLTATDANDQPIPGLVPFLTSSDSLFIKVLDHTVPSVSFNTYASQKRGSALITASTWVYGVARQDTLRITANYPEWVYVIIAKRSVFGDTTSQVYFPVDTVVIQPGGVVNWRNDFDQPIDVTFDDSAAVASVTGNADYMIYAQFGEIGDTASGNIPPFHNDPDQPTFVAFLGHGRMFPNAGIYPYRSKLTGSRGVVAVKAVP